MRAGNFFKKLAGFLLLAISVELVLIREEAEYREEFRFNRR
ncbi:hypothetical protein HMPREF1145_1386 [Oribacterium parvum ACB8]|nr:hypothetical protein HMPREF1145_1386 [Oribacterium parvum ACB8]